MRHLNKYYLDDEIVDLHKVCETTNAYMTYKEYGWKSSFNIRRGISVKEQ